MSDNSALQSQKQLALIKDVIAHDMYNLGDRFFEKVVLKLNEALQADYTFIGKLTDDKTAIETVAVTGGGKLLDNFHYYLKDTPCANVVGRTPCSYETGVQRLFPNDQLLVDMGIDAYVGVPLYNSDKEPTGILVCLFKQAITDVSGKEVILMIFASRAGAELEHKKLQSVLEQHKGELEKKVEKRTEELLQSYRDLKEKNQELEQTMIELKEAQSKLIQADKMASLGVLTAGVAHEINNPLNYIMGSARGLKKILKKHGLLEENKTQYLLDTIDEGINRVTKIVSGLNQFSRTGDQLDEACDLNVIIEDCLVLIQHSLGDGVTIEKNLDHGLALLQGNSGKLHQAIFNLLNNANQAINLKGAISVSTTMSDSCVFVTIKDTGRGIPDHLLTKVLDPFFTTKNPGEGTGLGLSITYGIINDHMGNLEITSVEHKGTTVKVTLPRHHA